MGYKRKVEKKSKLFSCFFCKNQKSKPFFKDEIKKDTLHHFPEETDDSEAEEEEEHGGHVKLSPSTLANDALNSNFFLDYETPEYFNEEKIKRVASVPTTTEIISQSALNGFHSQNNFSFEEEIKKNFIPNKKHFVNDILIYFCLKNSKNCEQCKKLKEKPHHELFLLYQISIHDFEIHSMMISKSDLEFKNKLRMLNHVFEKILQNLGKDLRDKILDCTKNGHYETNHQNLETILLEIKKYPKNSHIVTSIFETKFLQHDLISNYENVSPESEITVNAQKATVIDKNISFENTIIFGGLLNKKSSEPMLNVGQFSLKKL